MPVDTSMIDLASLIEREAGITFVGKAYGTGEKRTQKGPCPFCLGTDRFAVFINDTPQHYYCGIHGNGCGRHGDAITFIREWRGVDFFEACDVLEVDPGSDYTRSEKTYAPGALIPPGKQWQERAGAFIQSAHKKLGEPVGFEALEYLHSRGFTDETIRSARLGYIPLDSKTGRWFLDTFDAWGLKAEDYPDKPGVWLPRGILIPWYEGDVLWKLEVRRLPADLKKEDDQRYLTILGSQKALYNVDAICSDTPVVLNESVFDALSGIQGCEGLNVAFVATGSTKGAQDPLWIARVNKAPYTLVAFDDDKNKAGHEGASYWRSVLSRRYQVLPWKHDLNEMLQNGMDLREWVTSGIAEYEAIQASKQFVAAPIVAASEPAYIPVEDEPIEDELVRSAIDVAALRAEIGQLAREEEARWEYSTTELDPRWPAAAKVYKRLRLKEAQS